MGCLITLTDKDIFSEIEVEEVKIWNIRKTVKVIILNKKNEIALVTDSIYNSCLLPGGGIEEGEDFIQAIFREISEELGPEIVPFIRELFANGKFKELIDLETPEGHIVTYGGIVTEKVCKVLLAKQKDRSFGGFKIIRSNEINKIIDLQTINKDTGVTDEETIAMFRDEKEAVRLAFLKLG